MLTVSAGCVEGTRSAPAWLTFQIQSSEMLGKRAVLANSARSASCGLSRRQTCQVSEKVALPNPMVVKALTAARRSASDGLPDTSRAWRPLSSKAARESAGVSRRFTLARVEVRDASTVSSWAKPPKSSQVSGFEGRAPLRQRGGDHLQPQDRRDVLVRDQLDGGRSAVAPVVPDVDAPDRRPGVHPERCFSGSAAEPNDTAGVGRGAGRPVPEGPPDLSAAVHHDHRGEGVALGDEGDHPGRVDDEHERLARGGAAGGAVTVRVKVVSAASMPVPTGAPLTRAPTPWSTAP